MIQARFYRNSSGKLWGYEISGHAGYDEAGKDIICSAVSALAINTANSVEALAQEAPLVSTEEGRLTMEVPSLRSNRENASALLLLESLLLGLTDISRDYGKSYLKVSSNYKA